MPAGRVAGRAPAAPAGHGDTGRGRCRGACGFAAYVADPDAKALGTAVRRGLRAPGPRALAAEVRVAAQGTDVGVSVRGEEGECLLGSRVGGRVLVWRLSREQAMPGELSCDPATALGRLGTTPPH